MRRPRATALAGVTLAAFLAGCFAVPVITGRAPQPERLKTGLEVGRSHRGTVLEVLGAPDGVGMARLPVHGGERRGVWYYGSQTGSRKEVEQKLLLVLFDGPVLSGYLWLTAGDAVEYSLGLLP